MEVWTVTYDAYGDCGVVFVASSAEQAQAFVAKRTDNGSGSEYRIESFTTDVEP